MGGIADKGRELFDRIRSKKKQEEEEDQKVVNQDQMRKALTGKNARIPISMKRLDTDKWRLYGLHEDNLVKLGLELLDRSWPSDGLLEFPRRKIGTSMLFREPLIRSLLIGE